MINNNVFQRDANMALVAKTLWKNPGLSRSDLSQELGLYRSTITNIVNALLGFGVLREGECIDKGKGAGRKGSALYINDQFGCVAGFDIQPSHFRLVLLSLSGEVLWSEEGSLGPLDLEAMVRPLTERAYQAAKDLNLPLLSLCYGVPGIVDSLRGCVLHSGPFHITAPFDLSSYVRESFPDYPVFVENDADCASWLDLSLPSFPEGGNAVSLVADFHEDVSAFPGSVGIGLGIGLIINGVVYHGSHDRAGEFVTLSWTSGPDGQCGLPRKILESVATDEGAYGEWFADAMHSLVPFLSIMDFDVIYFHGVAFSDSHYVLDCLSRLVPSFQALLESVGTTMVFGTEGEFVTAKGAAMSYLMRLFALPSLADDPAFSWQKAFDQQKVGFLGK